MLFNVFERRSSVLPRVGCATVLQRFLCFLVLPRVGCASVESFTVSFLRVCVLYLEGSCLYLLLCGTALKEAQVNLGGDIGKSAAIV